LTKGNDDRVEKAFAELGKKRLYEVNDIVRWDGELFHVEGWIFEAGRSPHEHFEDIMYSLTRVYGDGTYEDFAEVYQDDEGLRLVCRAEFADEFLANLGMDAGSGGGVATIKPKEGGGKMTKMKPPEKSARQRREEAYVKRKRDYRAWMDEKLIELHAAKELGDLKRVAEVLREVRTRQLVYEAGGDIGGVNPKDAGSEN